MSTSSTGLTTIPKIKHEHVYLNNFSKMRVDLAAQVCIIIHLHIMLTVIDYRFSVQQWQMHCEYLWMQKLKKQQLSLNTSIRSLTSSTLTTSLSATRRESTTSLLTGGQMTKDLRYNTINMNG